MTFANVTSVLALFIALGGASYAAVNLPKNSVGANQIKKNAVGAPEIKSGAVRSAEVRDFSLLAEDFKQGQLPAGAQGLQGAPGEPGEPGSLGEVTVRENTEEADEAYVYCQEGEVAVGGGGNTGATGWLYRSEPIEEEGQTGWAAAALNPGGEEPKSTAFVLCVDVSP